MNATTASTMLRVSLLSVATGTCLVPLQGLAQETDHSRMHMPAPEKKPAAAQKSARKKATATPAATAKPDEEVDHAAMGHDMATPARTEQIDHSGMGHDTDAKPGEPTPMDHAAMGHDSPAAPTEPRTPIPAVTDEDRTAATPPPNGHPAHDNTIRNFVLLDRLEAWDADPGSGLEWEAQGWIGTDLDRLWLRSEGERVDGHTESADLEVLYGRSVARWWDVVAGIRHDFKPGASQDFAAIGVIGLAPYKFEVEATGYIGESGQTAARFEVEYETLLTNRLILQPQIEANVHGKSDERRAIGSGLSTAEVGLRLRYEINRQFAPYIGIIHERAFGRTADFRRADGEDTDDTRVVAGFRIWL